MIKIEGTVEFKEPKLEATVNSFKALKDQIKEAKGELAQLEQGSDAFVQKAAEIGALSNEVDDLNKSISAVSGAPIENLTGSFGLLSNQVQNLDFAGAESSLSSLFNVIKANPLAALASAALLVWQNFDKIQEVLGFLNPKISDNTAVLEKNKIALEDAKTASDKYIESLNKQLEILSLTNAPLAEILNVIQTRTKAQVSAIDLEIAAKDKNIESINKEIAAEADALRAAQLRSAGVNDAVLRESEQRTKALVDKKAAVEAEKAQLTDLALTRDLIIARGTKAEQDAKAAKDKLRSDAKAVEAQDADDFINLEQQKADYLNQLAEEKIAKDQERRFAEIDAEVMQAQFLSDALAQIALQEEAEKKRLDAEEKIRAQETADAKLEAQTRFTNGALALSSLYYEVASANAQKGSKEEQEAAKKTFNISKGLQLTNAVISGIQGVQAAFTSGMAVPIIGPATGAAYAIAAGVVAAANIAKIAKTQFNPTSSSASGTSVTPPTVSIPTPTAPQAPTIQNPPTTQLNPDGSIAGSSTDLAVMEGDMTTTQKRVKVLEGRSTF